MKNIFAVIKQFLIEIVIFVLTLINFIIYIINGNGLIVSIIYSLFFCILILCLLAILKPLVYRIFSKKMCTILQLTRCNTISMMPKKVRNENAFINNISEILTYAQQKNIKKMQATTHKIMVLYFLSEYTKYSKQEISDMINKMKENDCLNLDTSFGRVEIKYIGKNINNCNRYNKNKKGLSKIIEKKDAYTMEMYLK